MPRSSSCTRCQRLPIQCCARAALRSRRWEKSKIGAVIGVHGDDVVRVHVSPHSIIIKFGYCQKYQARSPLRVARSRRHWGEGTIRLQLQAVTIFVLDGVLPGHRHGTQPLVNGARLSAVEIVIDKDLPVAMNLIGPAVEVEELADAKRDQRVSPGRRECLQWRGLESRFHEYESSPSFNSDGNQPVVESDQNFLLPRTRGLPFERSRPTVFPTMVRTLQHRCVTARLGYDRRSVVPAAGLEGA